MEQQGGVLGLAEIRRSRGITLEQISKATKISSRSLQAIEEGEFKKLPGGIYNTSYIRQYARAINYDEQELLAYYYANSGVADEASDPKRSGLGIFGIFRPASTIASS